METNLCVFFFMTVSEAAHALCLKDVLKRKSVPLRGNYSSITHFGYST